MGTRKPGGTERTKQTAKKAKMKDLAASKPRALQVRGGYIGETEKNLRNR